MNKSHTAAVLVVILVIGVSIGIRHRASPRTATPLPKLHAVVRPEPSRPMTRYPSSAPGQDVPFRIGVPVHHSRAQLDGLPEAVIVRHGDGTTGVYAPDDWPADGDGVIVARKLSSGEIAWYAGPEAGPRSDPAAFVVPEQFTLPSGRRQFGRASDGTITIDGEPASEDWQCMLDGVCDR